MRISVDEQETVIQFCRAEDCMYVYTSDTTQMTKLDKKVEKYPGTWSLLQLIHDQSGDLVAKRYKANKKMLSFRNEKSNRSGNPNAGEGLRKWREAQKILNNDEDEENGDDE